MHMPMNAPPITLISKALLAVIATVSLTLALGCSLYKAQKACDEGRFEEAVHAYQQLLKQDPTNVKAKIGYRLSLIHI